MINENQKKNKKQRMANIIKNLKSKTGVSKK